jgi:ElaB/YqjD/DUF883 family membrane-anchored ribosome-binding protein
MAQSSHARTSNAMSDPKNKAGDQIRSAAEDASDRATRHVRQAGEGMQQVAGNMKSAIDMSLKEQPLATLGMAAAVAFLLGALWKR